MVVKVVTMGLEYVSGARARGHESLQASPPASAGHHVVAPAKPISRRCRTISMEDCLSRLLSNCKSVMFRRAVATIYQVGRPWEGELQFQGDVPPRSSAGGCPGVLRWHDPSM
jgi:hypothetical protein